MRFEILELAEQYGPICPVCVCECTRASRAEVEGTVRAGEQLEFLDGYCGLCHKHTPTLIAAKSVLASRLSKIADATGMVGDPPIAGAAGMVILPIAAVPMDIIVRVGTELSKQVRLAIGAYKAGKDAYTRATADQKTPQPLRQQPYSPTPQPKFDLPDSATADSLDFVRRSLIKMLNKLDRVHRRGEPLGKRIERLRGRGKLSPDVANAMKQITHLRNRVVYDEYVPVAEDCERLGTAYACLENWSRSPSIH
jgi:hypothetical protein